MRIIVWGLMVLAVGCGGSGSGGSSPTSPTSPTNPGTSGPNTTAPQLTAAFVSPDSALAFYVFGAVLPSGIQNPTWEIETASQSAPVFAAMTGKIMAITPTSQGDMAVTFQTSDDSIYVLVHDHVNDVRVSVGQTVTAGTQIGIVGRLGNGRGRTELQLNRRQPAPEVAVCLRNFFSTTINDQFQSAAQRLNGSSSTCLADTVVP